MGAYIFVSVLILIVCVLLILVVLVQNSKGGGLASNFASSNQMLGVRKTADFLEKATWSLAIALLVLSLFASLSIPREETSAAKSMIEEQVNNAPATTSPNFPTAAPAADNKNSKEENNKKK